MSLTLVNNLDIFLQPGEWYVGDRHTKIRTTLGSCVAVTLWHPERQIGAMCHYMLSTRQQRDGVNCGRYADEVMELLMSKLRQLGVDARDCETKLFGGASMIPTPTRDGVSVAANNVTCAHAIVKRHGLNLTRHHLGGYQYRQLIFDISTGEVWMRLGQHPDPTHRR